MSINRQNLTVIIVSFKSEHVIYDCIDSIDKDLKIIVIENSNDQIFVEKLETKYENVKCILSHKNLGMGAGNNLGIKNVISDYALILNPDVVLKKNTIEEIIFASKNFISPAIGFIMISNYFFIHGTFMSKYFEISTADDIPSSWKPYPNQAPT